MPGKLKRVHGGVATPRGFVSSAVSCGIKRPDSDRLDLALIVSQEPAVTTATFTTNKVRAAPVRVSQAHLRSNDIRAIVANSGNANACTGPRGIADAKQMASQTAGRLGLNMRQVLVCSTGIIGMPMPMERLEPKWDELVAGLRHGDSESAARAIMTSDTVPKSLCVRVPIGKKTVHIGAAAKGAGMICPSMATMLCFVTTDARVGKAELAKATACAVEKSFNRISIDGDMSTNDTVIVMANGAAGNRKIRSGTPSGAAFREALEYIMCRLARMIVGDGERVTKLVELRVRNARTYLDARRVAETVGNSLLVKSSWNGEDPNWGRVMDAIGYSRARIREEMVDIYFGGLIAARNGVAANTPYVELKKVVAKREFTLTIDLNLGNADHSMLTSDVSPEYVDFNRSEYAAPSVK